LFSKKALIAHVGDSRIYRYRDGLFDQLTIDDTVVQNMIEEGEIELDQANGHPLRHVLTQAIGSGLDEIHTTVTDVHGGDIFVLCSDGLYDRLSSAEILEILLLGLTREAVCDRLVDAALKNGAKDNVTVMIVWI
jgi:protein phosphatase